MLDPINPDYKPWHPGGNSKFPPHDAEFMAKVLDAGFRAFTGPLGMFGGVTAKREVTVIHRGRGRKWELFLLDDGADVASKLTTELDRATAIAVYWLGDGGVDATKEMLKKLE